MKKILTAKQKRFCEEYLVDLNAMQAAIRAGYSKNTAHAKSAAWLENVGIRDSIQKLMDKRSKKTEVTAEYVINSLQEIANRCMQKVAVVDSKGSKTGKYRFDQAGANKALELLGRHLKLFTDKVEHTGNITFETVNYADIKRGD